MCNHKTWRSGVVVFVSALWCVSLCSAQTRYTRHIPYAFENATNYVYALSLVHRGTVTNYSLNVGCRNADVSVGWVGNSVSTGSDVRAVHKCNAYVVCTNADVVASARGELSPGERNSRDKECVYKLSVTLRDWEYDLPGRPLPGTNEPSFLIVPSAFSFAADIDQNGRILRTDLALMLKQTGQNKKEWERETEREILMRVLCLFWECAVPRLPSASDGSFGAYRSTRDWSPLKDAMLQKRFSEESGVRWHMDDDKRGRSVFWQRWVEFVAVKEYSDLAIAQDTSREFTYDYDYGVVTEGSINIVNVVAVGDSGSGALMSNGGGRGSAHLLRAADRELQASGVEKPSSQSGKQ